MAAAGVLPGTSAHHDRAIAIKERIVAAAVAVGA